MESIECYILISGGRSSRFGSDKAAIELDGASLLRRHCNAIGDQVPIYVVGDESETLGANVHFLREEPAFGGPVSALDAAINHLPISVKTVAVVAVDMPYAVKAVQVLDRNLLDNHDAVLPTDDEEFPQPLCALYQVAALRKALAALAPVAGKSMRSLIAQLNCAHIRLGESEQYLLVDIDTPSDLEKVRDARMD